MSYCRTTSTTAPPGSAFRIREEDFLQGSVFEMLEELERSPTLCNHDDGLEGLNRLAEFLRVVAPGKVHGFGRPPVSPEPCHYPPGSEERIQVYVDRVASGFQVFHPEDC